MARTIWKGSLNFGLVNVPVGLYPATQDKAIHFNQLEAGYVGQDPLQEGQRADRQGSRGRQDRQGLRPRWW